MKYIFIITCNIINEYSKNIKEWIRLTKVRRLYEEEKIDVTGLSKIMIEELQK
jgi:hypothetical protein